MLYTILAYHVEAEVMSWTPDEDAKLMNRARRGARPPERPKTARPGGAARRHRDARTLRGPGAGMVIDGPFAETKEQLLGIYVVELRQRRRRTRCRARPAPRQSAAVYEIRPIRLYIPGEALPESG